MQNKIINILKEVVNNPDLEIGTDVEFHKIGVDSLAKTDLIISLEDEFCITINEDDTKRLKSVNETIKLITELKIS